MRITGENNPENSSLLSAEAGESYSSVAVDKGSNLYEEARVSTSTFAQDVTDTLHLAIPIFISRVSYVGMKTTDTALLGHVSGQALSAAALSDLWTMCTGVLLQGRVLGILVGQSVGAKNYKLAMIYLRISCIMLALLSTIVMVFWKYTQQVWESLGQSTSVAKDAGYYSSVFIWMIPAQIGFDQLAQFFSAQRIMKPEVVTALFALSFNLALGILFVFVLGYGFVACPIVTVAVDWFQFMILFGYFKWFQKHDSIGKHINDSSHDLSDSFHNETTHSWFSSWLDGITKARILTFSHLYIPAALALSSDFWRMGAVGAMAASIGEREVGLFNASYRILWITLTFVGALSGASGIKIGLRLGNGDHKGSKQASEVGVLMTTLLLFALSALVYNNSRIFGMVFTNDESYLDLFDECRLPFCCTLFFMNLSVAIETIPINMGRTGIVFYSGFVASWLGMY